MVHQNRQNEQIQGIETESRPTVVEVSTEELMRILSYERNLIPGMLDPHSQRVIPIMSVPSQYD